MFRLRKALSSRPVASKAEGKDGVERRRGEPGEDYAEETLEPIPMSLSPRKKSGSTRVIQLVGV